MNTAIASRTMDASDKIKNNGRNHLAHFNHGTAATARLAIKGPEVG